MSTNSLQLLTAGDKVIMSYSGDNDHVATVKRVTPSQVIIAGAGEGTERKFWSATGKEVGDASERGRYRWVTLKPATDEAVAAIRERIARSNALAFLHTFAAQAVPTADLVRIVAELKALGAK